MNIHENSSPQTKANPRQYFTRGAKTFLLSLMPILFLAALVSYRTGSLAGRLTGSLALATAAGHNSLGQWSIINRLNMFSHEIFPPRFIIYVILTRFEIAGKRLSIRRR